MELILPKGDAAARWRNGVIVVAPKTWWEVRENGSTETFVEVGRTVEYVEIYDKSRDVGIRLYDTHAPLRQPGTMGEFRPFFEGGRWVTPPADAPPRPVSP